MKRRAAPQKVVAATVMLALVAWGIGYAVATLRAAVELEEVGALAGLVLAIFLSALTIVLVWRILRGGRFADRIAIAFYSIFALAALGRLIHEATQSRLDASVGDFAPPIIVLAGCIAIVVLLMPPRSRSRG